MYIGHHTHHQSSPLPVPMIRWYSLRIMRLPHDHAHLTVELPLQFSDHFSFWVSCYRTADDRRLYFSDSRTLFIRHFSAAGRRSGRKRASRLCHQNKFIGDRNSDAKKPQKRYLPSIMSLLLPACRQIYNTVASAQPGLMIDCPVSHHWLHLERCYLRASF